MRWLVLLLLLPTASACSLAGPVPLPGAFILWDPDTGDTQSFEVTKRGLGADCSLSNRFAIGAGQFAWVEGNLIRVASLATGTITEHYWRDDLQGIGLVEEGLIVYSVTGRHPAYAESYHLIDDEVEVIYQSQSDGVSALAGSLRYRAFGESPLVDVLTGETILATTDGAALGGGDLYLIGVTEQHLFFERDDIHVYDIDRDRWETFTVDGWSRAVGDRIIVGQDDVLTVIDIDTKQRRGFERPPLDLLGAGEGWVVFGAYSIDHLEEPWRPPFEIRPETEWIPMPFLLPVALLVAARLRGPGPKH